MNKYHTKCKYISQYIPYAFFESDSNYNLNVVSKEWLLIQGVGQVELSGGVGDGSYIIAEEVTPSYVKLVYSYGYGDCPSGCINRRNWAYKVYYNCDVEFAGTWEGQLTMPPPPTTIPGCFGVFNTVVMPNPFKDQIVLEYNKTYESYAIADITGKTVKQGVPVYNTIAGLGDLQAGIYILMLNSDGVISKMKIVKE
jgi:hypothetical protein